jgi:hypothetical protein
MIHERSRCFSA